MTRVHQVRASHRDLSICHITRWAKQKELLSGLNFLFTMWRPKSEYKHVENNPVSLLNDKEK